MKGKNVKRPTVAALMAEMEVLRKRVAELEARPPVVIHNHPPQQLRLQQPHVAPFWPNQYPWNPGTVYCGSISATDTLSWNGGGSGCHGGGSGG